MRSRQIKVIGFWQFEVYIAGDYHRTFDAGMVRNEPSRAKAMRLVKERFPDYVIASFKPYSYTHYEK